METPRIRAAIPADAAAIAKVHVDTWRSIYSDLVPAEFLQSLSYESRAQYWHNAIEQDEPSFFHVAEDSEVGIIGFSAAGPERTGDTNYKGELYAIYMLTEQQGKGVGKKLVLTIARQFLSEDVTSLLVWVLRENSFRDFYIALVGEYVREQEIEIGGAKLIEEALVGGIFATWLKAPHRNKGIK